MPNQKRYIPLPVRRQLRQEAFFGCAECGNPILEYHHIIPWSESKHNDPDHMVALCPLHHTEYGKRRRQDAYEVKANPRNRLLGAVLGELHTNADTSDFLVGSNTFQDTPVIFQFYGQPILGYRVEDGRAEVSAYIPDANGWPDLRIKNNDLMVATTGKWDIEFRTNYLKVQRRERETYFELDLRNEVAEITAVLSLLGQEFRFTPSSTSLDGFSVSNSWMQGCAVGIAHGDGKTRVHWPTYAMRNPRIVTTKL